MRKALGTAFTLIAGTALAGTLVQAPAAASSGTPAHFERTVHAEQCRAHGESYGEQVQVCVQVSYERKGGDEAWVRGTMYAPRGTTAYNPGIYLTNRPNGTPYGRTDYHETAWHPATPGQELQTRGSYTTDPGGRVAAAASGFITV